MGDAVFVDRAGRVGERANRFTGARANLSQNAQSPNLAPRVSLIAGSVRHLTERFWGWPRLAGSTTEAR